MAAVDFYIIGEVNLDLNSQGSGLGFYGDSGFGASVEVGSWNGRTFLSDSNGVLKGSEANNTKYLNPTGVIVGQVGNGINLLQLPNYQSTLKISFTHDVQIKTANAQLRIYDRDNINLGASGVTTKVAEIVHIYPIQEMNGSGDSSWLTPIGSSVVVDFSPSPGLSGFQSPGNPDHLDTRHDWYAAISASPDSIGSKTLYGLYFSLEYL